MIEACASSWFGPPTKLTSTSVGSSTVIGTVRWPWSSSWYCDLVWPEAALVSIVTQRPSITGDKATIYRLVREGFHLGLLDPREAAQFGATVWAQGSGLATAADRPRTKRPSSALPEAGRWRGDLWQLLTPASAWAHHGAHPDDKAQPAITHSARLILVDRQGQIRHYYNSTHQDDLRRVPRDVRLLLQGR